MKILITGGSGLLGQYLNLFLSKKHEILTLYNSNTGNCQQFNSRNIDLRDEIGLKKIFSEFQPKLVIHSAAITSTLLDGKYSLKDYFQVNVLATENIARLSSISKSRLIYISTDLVYDGNRGSFQTENSKLNPVSPYAESKLIGEEKVRAYSDDYLILRLALMIGFGLNHSVCHFQTMYENLLKNKSVKLFTDQFRSPISLLEAASVIEKIIDSNLPSGIFNLGGHERISRFELGLMLVNSIRADKDLLIPISLEEAPQVPTVKDVSLNIDKLKSYGIEVNTLEKMIYDSMIFNNKKIFPSK